FGFGESRGRHFGSDGRPGAKSGRRTRRKLRELLRDVFSAGLHTAARSDGSADETERSLSQKIPARFGHGSSARNCSRVLQLQEGVLASIQRKQWAANCRTTSICS